MLLSASNITKEYYEGSSKRLVLDNVSLEARIGEFVLVTGRSGSGKSTLLNLISGIDTPNTGSVNIDNTNITKLSETNRTIFRRENIGFIFQFFNLIPTLTVKENLILPLDLLGYTRNSKNDEARLLLKKIGLSDREDSYPDRLSGGEQQRVAIARAIIHSPKIVLADEPTGNLDARTGKEILELFNTLTKERNMTVIMVTHSSEAELYTNKILDLHDFHLIKRVKW
ncbi:MAG: ABC transporter ATP-binding protein [Chloroflexi bacterium]|nr:ABC transporter ATP-binding protein [Chloroflexota bacterium]|tara:strand:- start:3800 stop:4480 length:681 start_codon:yes stop_codon:yes gene_type:complete